MPAGAGNQQSDQKQHFLTFTSACFIYSSKKTGEGKGKMLERESSGVQTHRAKKKACYFSPPLGFFFLLSSFFFLSRCAFLEGCSGALLSGDALLYEAYCHPIADGDDHWARSLRLPLYTSYLSSRHFSHFYK